MKVITIGRSSNSDIQINDSYVGRVHCQIVQDDNGNYRLIDLDSKNGTYVNGKRIHGNIRLKLTDIVRIGKTTLPWQNYFLQEWIPKDTDKCTSKPGPVNIPNNPASSFPPSGQATQQSGLGLVALVLSIVGMVLLIYCAIQIMKWGIFALIGNASTFIWVSVGLNILALILAKIADYKEYKDSDAASIAEGISFFCLIVVIGFYLYLKYGDPNMLNPLRNIFK